MVRGCDEPVHVAPTFAPSTARDGAAVGREVPARLSSFADVLLALGFRDAHAVEAAVTRWLQLFEVVQPTAILCDCAPLGLLAACVAGIPATQISNGFDVPPIDFPLFDATVRGPYLERANAQKLELLDRTIASVGHALGASGLRLADFVGWPNVAIDGIPETDPYGTRAKGRYIGPFMSSAHTRPPCWPDAEGGMRVFVYLRGRQTLAVLEALRSTGSATCCLWPDAPEEALSRFHGTMVQVTREPQNLPMVLSQADAVINYGSSGVLTATLLAGKPQLMLPTDMEKLMFARRVEQLGAGVEWQAHQGRLEQAMDRLLKDPTLVAVAQGIASRHGARQFELQRRLFLDELIYGSRAETQAHEEGKGSGFDE